MLMFGTAGWSYDDWIGPVYPAKAPKGFDRLSFVINYLDVIEINSSFYHPPSEKSSQLWAKRAKAKKHFTFTIKLWEKFTHKRDDNFINNEIIFKNSIEPLMKEGKLGALLIQFPWSFSHSRDNENYLISLALSFKEYNPCIELRNASWMAADIKGQFSRGKIGFVNIDQPDIPNSLRKTSLVTNKTGYFRIHGRNIKNWFKKSGAPHEKYDYNYSNEELIELTEVIRKIDAQAPLTFVIANNHFMGSAFKNSLELKSMLTNEKLRIPKTSADHFKDLEKIASSIDPVIVRKQRSLFDDY